MMQAEAKWTRSLLDELSAGTFPHLDAWRTGTKAATFQRNSPNSPSGATRSVGGTMPAAQYRTRHRRRHRRPGRRHRTCHGRHRRRRLRGAYGRSGISQRDRWIAGARTQRAGGAVASSTPTATSVPPRSRSRGPSCRSPASPAARCPRRTDFRRGSSSTAVRCTASCESALSVQACEFTMARN